MIEILPNHSERFARLVGPETDEILKAMDEFGKENPPDWVERFPETDEFPTVGPTVGGWLQMLAGLADARRIFEFGSGFGYSAYWFARGLPSDGEIILTEVDEDELAMAREFLDRGGVDAVARYELGDAFETLKQYDGPFDIVLLDHENDRYREAFDAVRGKLADGGIVIAENVMQAPSLEFSQLLGGLSDGDRPAGTNEHTTGIFEYLDTVREDPAFETTALPLGGGITISRKTGE